MVRQNPGSLVPIKETLISVAQARVSQTHTYFSAAIEKKASISYGFAHTENRELILCLSLMDCIATSNC